MQKFITPFAYMLPLAKFVAARSWTLYENNTIYCVGQVYSCDLPRSETAENRMCDLPQLDPNNRLDFEVYSPPDPRIGGAIIIPTGVVAKVWNVGLYPPE